MKCSLHVSIDLYIMEIKAGVVEGCSVLRRASACLQSTEHSLSFHLASPGACGGSHTAGCNHTGIEGHRCHHPGLPLGHTSRSLHTPLCRALNWTLNGSRQVAGQAVPHQESWLISRQEVADRQRRSIMEHFFHLTDNCWTVQFSRAYNSILENFFFQV